MKIYNILYILCICILPGCATVEYNKVDPNNDNSKGIRFYNASPYLLVYTNGKGGLTTQVLMIADPAKKMSAHPKTFMANAQTTMEFDKGVYKNAKNTIDASGVPVAIINAIKSAGPALLAAANDPTGSPGIKSMPAPHLYKIVINGNTVSFVGGPGDTPITVNLLPQEEKKKS